MKLINQIKKHWFTILWLIFMSIFVTLSVSMIIDAKSSNKFNDQYEYVKQFKCEKDTKFIKNGDIYLKRINCDFKLMDNVKPKYFEVNKNNIIIKLR